MDIKKQKSKPHRIRQEKRYSSSIVSKKPWPSRHSTFSYHFYFQLNKKELFRPAATSAKATVPLGSPLRSELVMSFAFLNLPHWQLLCFFCNLRCAPAASKTTAARFKRACWSLRVTAIIFICLRQVGGLLRAKNKPRFHLILGDVLSSRRVTPFVLLPFVWHKTAFLRQAFFLCHPCSTRRRLAEAAQRLQPVSFVPHFTHCIRFPGAQLKAVFPSFSLAQVTNVQQVGDLKQKHKSQG